MPHVKDYSGSLPLQSELTDGTFSFPEANNSSKKRWTSTRNIHDRDDCLEKLIVAYEQCCRQGVDDKGVVIITGPSGVGKTTLALSIQERVQNDKGYFLSGKFDQLTSCSPLANDSYAPFVEAMTRYTNLIMQSGERTIKSVRVAIKKELDLTELRVLRATIPALCKIIGTATAAPSRKIGLQGADAESRFAFIFCKLIKTISSLSHPIVLLLDDLQWASERGSILLLEALAKLGQEPECSHFLLMGTYRTDVHGSAAMDLSQSALSVLNSEAVQTIRIELANLSWSAVEAIVSNGLGLETQNKNELVKAIYDLTDGNAFYVCQLVREIQMAGKSWQSVFPQASHQCDDRSVMHHLNNKLCRLSCHVKGLLQVAACLGTTFSEDCVFEGAGMSFSAFCTALMTIEDQGIIEFDQMLHTGRFKHDRFQQAAYELIPEAERDELHLLIGRRLRKLVKDTNEDHLLAAANQIRRGIHLISDEDERKDLASFFQRAGETAAAASTFPIAADYLRCGIALLNRQHWSHQYELSLALHNTAAEIEYYNGNLFRVDALVARIRNHAKCFNDTLIARFTHIYSLGTRGEMDQAIDDGLNLLKDLGEPFPRKVSLARIGMELLHCKRLLRGKDKIDILNLPRLKTKKQLTSMRLMNIVYSFAYFTRKELMPLLASRLVRITLRYGLCEMSSIGFAALGLVFSTLGFVDEAYRYSQLAILISEIHPSDEWQSHIAANIYAFAYPLKHPLKDSLEPLIIGHRAGLVAGDIHASLVCASISCMFSMHCGNPLPLILNDLHTYRNLCIQYGQHSTQTYFDIMSQFCLNMMGESNDPIIFTGGAMNEEKAFQVFEEQQNPFALAALLNSKHSVAVYLNDYPSANAVKKRLRKVKSKLLPFALQIHNFLQALASAALSRTSRYHRQQARQLLSKLRRSAEHSPENFLNKVYLVEAKMASSCGNITEAMSKYKMSMLLAQKQQCVREEALACEHAGYLLREHGKFDESAAFLLEARSLYGRWGAKIKADQLTAALDAHTSRVCS